MDTLTPRDISPDALAKLKFQTLNDVLAFFEEHNVVGELNMKGNVLVRKGDDTSEYTGIVAAPVSGGGFGLTNHGIKRIAEGKWDRLSRLELENLEFNTPEEVMDFLTKNNIFGPFKVKSKTDTMYSDGNETPIPTQLIIQDQGKEKSNPVLAYFDVNGVTEKSKKWKISHRTINMIIEIY